jgi:hypothetical protein
LLDHFHLDKEILMIFFFLVISAQLFLYGDYVCVHQLISKTLLTKIFFHVLDLLSSLYVSTDLYRHQSIAGVRICLSLHQIIPVKIMSKYSKETNDDNYTKKSEVVYAGLLLDQLGKRGGKGAQHPPPPPPHTQ